MISRKDGAMIAREARMKGKNENAEENEGQEVGNIAHRGS